MRVREQASGCADLSELSRRLPMLKLTIRRLLRSLVDGRRLVGTSFVAAGIRTPFIHVEKSIVVSPKLV